MSIKTIYKIHTSHPSKRKKTEKVSVEGYGQEAAYAVDKKFSQKGSRFRKVLVGFEIDGQFVPSELSNRN